MIISHWFRDKVIAVVCTLVVFASFVPHFEVAYAGYECASAQAGDWNTAATWGTCNSTVPQVGDNVTVSHAVTIGAYTINGVTDITIASGGTLTQSNVLTQTIAGDLTVQSGGTLTHGGNSTTHAYELDIVAVNIDIQTGGFINVDGLGYNGGSAGGSEGDAGDDPDGTSGGGAGGVVNGDGGAGGAHFGDGGRGDPSISGGSAYGDISNPTTLGAGGGSSYSWSICGAEADGGAGGGSVTLNASSGTITVDGTITADGEVGGVCGGWSSASGGGAGGSVKLVADTFDGTPDEFSAIGGSGGNSGNDGGGGGGGGVYIEYTTLNNIVGYPDVYGGIAGPGSYARHGSAGLVYIKDTNGTSTLVSDNNGTNSSSYGETLIGTAALSVDEIIIQNYAVVNIESGQALTINSATPFTSGDSNGTLKISTGTLNTQSSLTVADTILDFWQTSTWTSSSSTDVTIASGGIFEMNGFTTATGPLTFDDVVINSSGVIRHTANTTIQSSIVNLSATTMTIDSGGSIDADGLGYTGGDYSGDNGDDPDGTSGGGTGTSTSSDGGGGGAHLGNGGAGKDGAAGGTFYVVIGSLATMGAGGGSAHQAGVCSSGYNGGAGGGLILLNITNSLTFNGGGTITADGAIGGICAGWASGAGGGAGGGINITASSVTGTPTSISAVGGAGGDSSGDGGGGGGGGVHIVYTSANSISDGGGYFSVAGGSGQDTGVAGSDGAPLFELGNTAPTVTINSAVQKTDGSGGVDIEVEVDDADDNTVSLTVKYEATACTGSESNTTLDSTPANVTATTGTPTASGAQVSTILTSSGANTVGFDWLSATDVAAANGTYCVQITPNDGTVDGSAVTTALTVDNVDPTAPGSFAFDSYGSVVLTWTAATENNHNHYEIWYDTVSSITQGDDTETEWDDSDDANLLTIGTTTTTIIGATESNVSYFKIWAIDDSGNFSTSSEIYSVGVPIAPTVDNPSISTLDVLINGNSNPAAVEFAIYEANTGQYVQADETLGGSAVWQVVGTDAGKWGENTSVSGKVQVSGLSRNTSYSFRVKARNSNTVETSQGTAASLYTLAEPSSAPTVNTPTASSLDVTISEGSNPSATTYKIQETGGSLYVQADGTLGAGEVWQTAVTWGTPTVTGLSVNTQYTFVTTGRNVDLVVTAASDPTSAYTAANVPGTPTVDGAATTTLDVTIETNSNLSTTEYYIYEVNTAQYVQADGTLAGVVVWQNIATWGAPVIVTGLSVNTTYDFSVRARNGDNVETVNGTSASSYTLANVPGAPIVDGATVTTLDVTLDVNSNPADTTFAIQETGDSSYVQTEADLDLSEVWQMNATWGTVTVTGLNPNASYTFQVKAMNGDSTETVFGTVASAVYTLANAPSGVSASTSGSNVVVSWGENSNSAGTEYYVSRSDGGVNSGWITTTTWTDTAGQGGSNYTYSVKARNASLVETTTATSTGVVYPGGGVGFNSSRNRGGSTQQKPKAVVVEDEEEGDVVVVEEDGESAKESVEDDSAVEEVVVNVEVSVSQELLAENIVDYVGGQADVFAENDVSEAYLTRAAAVKAVCLMVGIDLDSDEYIGTQSILGRLLDYLFTDVDGYDEWYAPYVGVAKIIGVINGYDDNTFRPDGNVSRVEAIKMIVVANQWSVSEFNRADLSFADVDGEQWYAGFLQTAYEYGLLRNYIGNEYFEPSELITVSEFVDLISYINSKIDTEFLLVMGD